MLRPTWNNPGGIKSAALFQRPLPERDGPLSRHHRSPEIRVFSTPLQQGSLGTSMPTPTFECDLLSSFALSVNFPQSLVERDFHDYFNDSLTLPLARVRPILRSSNCLSLHLGAHFVTSCSLPAGSNKSLQEK